MSEKKEQRIPTQLVNSWNKELERLHKSLQAAGDIEEKAWIRARIEELQKLMFGSAA